MTVGASLGYMLYNDQWPNGAYTESYGHSKGVLVFDNDGGFFMEHSVPDYPNYAADGYLYGSSQEKYGQQLTCFTLSLDEMNAVAEGMRYSGPWVYDYAPLPAYATGNTSLPAVTAVINGSTRHYYYTNASSEVHTTTLGGLELSVFAKTGGYGQDMIDQLISPALDAPLWSQSWLNSGGPLGPYCPADHDYVVDTEELIYGDGTVPWPTADDHAKWVVGVPSADQDDYPASADSATSKSNILDDDDDARTDDGNIDDNDEAGHCCYSSQKTCDPGDVCCLANCEDPSTCSYTESGCSGAYGQVHDCIWEGDDEDGICVVP